MNTGKGIAIPTKKPIQAVGKFSVILDGAIDGLTLSVRGATKQVIRHALATGGYIMAAAAIGDPEPQPEPETRAKRTLSPQTIAKMKDAQIKRQAELRKAKEATAATAPITKARKGKIRKEPEKTMTAAG